MHSKIVDNGPRRTFVLVFNEGDRVMENLHAFARKEGLTAAHFTAIGALREVTVGIYDFDRNDYVEIPLGEQVEVLTLNGNVTLKDGQPAIHAHLVVAKRDGTAHGGHLIEAVVRPTLEVVLAETGGKLQRTIDPESGFGFIDLQDV
jgi:predicted DNA-binding protein with PD1-like motif